MKKGIIHILAALALICGCSDPVELDGDKYFASANYAEPETTKISVGRNESTSKISVTGNCSWVCASDCSWLEVSNEDDRTLSIIAKENMTDIVRTGKVMLQIDGKVSTDIIVVQDATYAQTDNNSFLVRGIESTHTVNVSSNGPWSCKSDCNWITTEKSDDGKSFKIKVSRNPDFDGRNANVHVCLNDIILSSVAISQLPGETELVSGNAESANCYIVSRKGAYVFPVMKGNSNQYIQEFKTAEVLWESFGTDVTPNVGDLIPYITTSEKQIIFITPTEFRKGNAVIAAKDDAGNILWSWHIWFTELPEEHAYSGNVGIMMDRNLGAVNATVGDRGSYGLLYQWGRKDPFIPEGRTGGSTNSTHWDITSSEKYTGTIEYAIQHPMTYLEYNDKNYDWYYMDTERYTTDLTRWGTQKTMYDPCPSGWQVPQGGYPKWGGTNEETVWTNFVKDEDIYNFNTNGIVFPSEYCGTEAWYPACGYCGLGRGNSVYSVGSEGYYWSCTIWDEPYYHQDDYKFSCFIIQKSGSDVGSCSYKGITGAYGNSVRCAKEK